MNRLQNALQGAHTALCQAVCGWCGIRLAALCSAATVAACRGVDDAGTPTQTLAGQVSVQWPATAGAVVSPLLADDGSILPSDPAAVPADPGARTRAGLYATASQGEQLTHALQDRLVRVAVACCSPELVDEAVNTAWGVQETANLPPETPFLVLGPDARLNAAAAERLAESGATRVWVVAP